MFDRDMVAEQFGGAIEMLERAMRACPDALWGDRTQRPEYWYVAYHTLFFLDLYLSDSSDGFAPPPPFTLSELDPAGVLPERVYGKDELLRYLGHCRDKCKSRIAALTDANAAGVCVYTYMTLTRAEALIYGMRHVQHHAAQLYLILRQQIDDTPGWVDRAPV